ncbi:MAG: endolytic transglycosylase MltG [Cytophagales bacterium]|nr:endolytic transglycosylase MltG [Cytophagales bacterium]
MKRKKFVAVFMIVGTIMASSFAFYFYQMLFTPNILVERNDELFAIAPGATFDKVQDDLYDLGIVNDLVSFSFLAKLRDYDDYVKPGLYKLRKDMSNLQAINLLRSGAQEPVRVTFTVARKIEELPGKLAPYVYFSEEDLAKVMLSESVAENYGFTSEEFIAMFIPNTYEVYWTITPEQFLDRMKKEYDRFWNAERVAKAEALGLTPKEVATLASIVESEISFIDEAPKVAGMYLNRLKLDMLLQADPTLKFALGDFAIRRVLNKDKEVDSPYNTYKYAGLPPGPISLPSIPGLNAVLNAEDHDYLYLCAKADFSGYHAFATNLTQHNKNARELHRALNKAKIYR